MGHCIARVATLLQNGATQTVTIPGRFQVINAFSAFQIVDTPIIATTNDFLILPPPNGTTGTFRYTRRVNPGLTYSVWTFANLTVWKRDTGAVEGTVTKVGGVETVPVTLSAALLVNPVLFVRMQAQ